MIITINRTSKYVRLPKHFLNQSRITEVTGSWLALKTIVLSRPFEVPQVKKGPPKVYIFTVVFGKLALRDNPLMEAMAAPNECPYPP